MQEVFTREMFTFSNPNENTTIVMPLPSSNKNKTYETKSGILITAEQQADDGAALGIVFKPALKSNKKVGDVVIFLKNLTKTFVFTRNNKPQPYYIAFDADLYCVELTKDFKDTTQFLLDNFTKQMIEDNKIDFEELKLQKQ